MFGFAFVSLFGIGKFRFLSRKFIAPGISELKKLDQRNKCSYATDLNIRPRERSPLGVVTSTPAIRPCMASSGFIAVLFETSSELIFDIAPVTSFLFPLTVSNYNDFRQFLG